MHRNNLQFDRRQLLRGSGVAIALPFLESLAKPSRTLAKDNSTNAAASPMRMVCIGLEYGLYPSDFFPSDSGRDYQLTKLLAPLAPIKNDLTVLSGLDHPGINGGHYVTHTFLSGIRSDQANSHQEGNITVDQKAAEFIGSETRYPSLQLGLGGDGVSWTRNGVQITGMTNLQTMFDALFLEGPKSEQQSRAASFELNKSILDVVRDDAAALKKQSSRNDLYQLDEFFTSIRNVEHRIAQSAAWLYQPKPKTDYRLPRPLPTSFDQEVPLYYDLMKLALQTDSTRVLSMGIHGWKGDSGLPGVSKGYHDLTHHGRNQSKLDQLSIVETFHTSQFARFLLNLKQSQASVNESLLDKTMVLFGSGLGSASSHSNRNLPLVLAGGGFQHGEHKSFPKVNEKQTPACNLFVSMLQRLGMPLDQFGTSTGTLEGLA